MKQRIRKKIFRKRYVLNYSLGQIFEASRGIVFWVYPGNGFRYYLNYHNGKIIKKADDGFFSCRAIPGSKAKSAKSVVVEKNMNENIE